MRNLTLRIEDDTLAQARRIAAERATSVNSLIREYLDDLVRQHSRREHARREILELCHDSTALVGKRTWTREELHER
jgi:hypothetical protein